MLKLINTQIKNWIKCILIVILLGGIIGIISGWMDDEFNLLSFYFGWIISVLSAILIAIKLRVNPPWIASIVSMIIASLSTWIGFNLILYLTIN